VATLATLRDSERQAELLETDVLPIVALKVATAEQTYGASNGMLSDLIEPQRAELELRGVIAEARILREKKLADIEALLGVDVETISADSSVSAGPSVSADSSEYSRGPCGRSELPERHRRDPRLQPRHGSHETALVTGGLQ
jgi:hypothetical protein